MRRFSSLILTCFVLVIAAFLVKFTTGNNLQPFTPSIEENRETDTSPEEITETMSPVCKLFFEAHPSFKSMSGAFSPNGRYFTVSNAESSFYVTTTLFDLKTGEILKQFHGWFTNHSCLPVAFSPDSRRVAFLCGYLDSRLAQSFIMVWDIPEDKEVCRIPVNNRARMSSLRFSEDGKKLRGVIDNAGRIWDIEVKKIVRTFRHDTSPPSVFSVFHCYPDLSHALVSDEKTGKTWLRDLSNGEEVERMGNFCFIGSHWLTDNFKNLSMMVFSEDKKLFALQMPNQNRHGSRLFVWDATTGNDICTVPLAYQLTAMMFLPGSRTLITVSDPGLPYVFANVQHIPLATPMRKPVAKTETRAIIEFWDIDHLIWHKKKVNLFPRKIKTCYLEGQDDIHFMVASPDGKMLYMRSGKEIMQGNINLSIANGYIFALDPDDPPDLQAEIQLKEQEKMNWLLPSDGQPNDY